ncbi:hypothetical protein [Fibrella aquatilis]|uniref:Lipoprotein n=1 Tax=Fibrella aquatilis TaxID=2817059 RepID=A0A939G9G1_9BACT|nr:hypothetical protein [Fibrella aquatilis]MBO0933440.1 hypothetical protein [Fibrella aquatilis]
MKKIIALLFVGSVLTFAACQSKPKTEEAAVDSTAAALDSSAAAADTSAKAAVDSASASMSAVAPADSAKK